MDAYFSALEAMDAFNGVIHLSQGKETLLARSYRSFPAGPASLAVRPDLPFDVHSVSKLMVRYLLHELADRGQLELGQSISAWFPDFPRGEEITLAMLLQHRSGLPRELRAGPDTLIDLRPAEIIDLIQRQELQFAPGTDRQYSNLGYLLLYEICGRLGGDSFAGYLQRALFDPLGMSGSGAHFHSGSAEPPRLAANHEVRDGEVTRVVNVGVDEFPVARIYSTAPDLARFLAHLQRSPHRHALAEEGFIAQSGGSDGVRAHVIADLETGRNLVLLANTDALPFRQITRDVRRMLRGEPVALPRPLQREATVVDGRMLDRYAGRYRFPDMNDLRLEFRVRDGRLTVRQDGEEATALYAENDSTFFADPTAADGFVFRTDSTGRVRLEMGWRGIVLPGLAE